MPSFLGFFSWLWEFLGGYLQSVGSDLLFSFRTRPGNAMGRGGGHRRSWEPSSSSDDLLEAEAGNRAPHGGPDDKYDFFVDSTDAELSHHPLLPPSNGSSSSSTVLMHRPKLQDRFGLVRFSVGYDAGRELLVVTVLDAWDLPPMGQDGKADPYVEVSLVPSRSDGGGGGDGKSWQPCQQKRFVTSVKSGCLNPTFNETSELALKPDEVDSAELVVKVLDSDFPLQDELIGTVRLPLSSALARDRRQSRGQDVGGFRCDRDAMMQMQQHTCLILHDKVKNRHTLTAADAAKLNLKVSRQCQQIYGLQLELNGVRRSLDGARKSLEEERLRGVDLKIENLNLEREIDELLHDSGFPVKGSAATTRRKSCSLRRLDKGSSRQSGVLGKDDSRPSLSRSFPNLAAAGREIRPKKAPKTGRASSAEEKTVELISCLRDSIQDRDREIQKLTQRCLLASGPSPDQGLPDGGVGDQSQRNGFIELGLTFFSQTRCIRIDVVAANRLKAVNIYSDDSDPFVKVKVFRQRRPSRSASSKSLPRPPAGSSKGSPPSSSPEGWSFRTKTIWKNLAPKWNEHFIVADVGAADLPFMSAEVTVMDKGRLRSSQPLGQVKLGPGQAYDNLHWEEMAKSPNCKVSMVHPLRDV